MVDRELPFVIPVRLALTGTLVSNLKVNASQRVIDLKHALACVSKTPACYQHLILDESHSELGDSQTLSESAVQEGSTLLLARLQPVDGRDALIKLCKNKASFGREDDAPIQVQYLLDSKVD